ncbi:MAG: histidine ammonia-lyase, partial [Desulfuromusa sp.]|nr:histidine ammonia-lyase [Desulfuromusa sp.]
AGILAIELLAACQGVDFRAPLKTSDLQEQAKQILRDEVPFYNQDRYFAPDIEKAIKLIQSGRFTHFVSTAIIFSR